MPEFTAPKLGTRPNVITIDAVLPADPNGVLYKLGGFARSDVLRGGRHPLLRIQPLRDSTDEIRAQEPLPQGEATIEIDTSLVDPKQPPRGPLNVAMKVNGETVAEGTVPISVPLAFTATECLDIGVALGSPVSPDYYDKKPFRFNGKIEGVHVRYTDTT